MHVRILGIEATAHTFGVGIVESDPRCSILANERALYRPEPAGTPGGTTGGIHPRQAANHHARLAPDVLRAALAKADLGPDEIDAVAFSQGPGLGPCLRTGATVARALSLRWDVPLVAVNHCVAHLEIGRALCDVDDPVLLYVSGGNTQVIAYAEDRYRVFGETLDVGVGNFLDKFARHLGLPFPGGPGIERLAAKGARLLDLPYSVKGMDVAFSGVLTAAMALLDDHAVEDVCYSVQETTFAMLAEVTERAVAHVGKADVVMGGGVACNERLTEMVRACCEARGVGFHRPAKEVLVDNGAMIAWNGALAVRALGPTPLEHSTVDQRQRTDDVEAPWRKATETPGDLRHGAEAIVSFENGTARKLRVVKAYRHPDLDERLRRARTRMEARLLALAREAGVATPIVFDVDIAGASVVMERLGGPRLRETLDEMAPTMQQHVLRAFGAALGRLHDAGIAHGDPTTSNALLDADGGIVLIDLGLAQRTTEAEDHATDLHVLGEALEATHRVGPAGFEAALAGYGSRRRAEALKQLETVRARGRYRGT